MKMFVCALVAGVMVLLCPMRSARADVDADVALDVDANAASAVFRAMHDDLERCFARVTGNAFLMVEALVDDRGRVRRVETTGDQRAGPATRACVERRVARARFPLPRGGGTSRVRTTLALTFD